MDVSKEYIKMCDCEEIQNHEWKDGDFLIYKRDFQESDLYHNWCISKGDNDIYRIGNGGNEYVVDEIGAIWLPRQDQLQEMVLPILKDKYNKVYDLDKMNRSANWLLRLFDRFVNPREVENYQSNNSMEQLWLAFVMKEKHNKTWDKDKWRSCCGQSVD